MNSPHFKLYAVLGTGASVVILIIFASEFHNREFYGKCFKQERTQFALANTSREVARYYRKHNSFPETLSQIENNEYEIKTHDFWGEKLHYKHSANGFSLTSYGADRAPGGIGIDSDLQAKAQSLEEVLREDSFYWQYRNRKKENPTLVQYFSSNDVDRGSTLTASMFTVIVIMLTTLFSIQRQENKGLPLNQKSFLFSCVMLVLLSTAVACVLLPAHIPNGH